MSSPEEELRQFFEKETPLSLGETEEILSFYTFLRAQNEIQNLTRLISPKDFFFGHWMDVWELKKHEFEFPALDLGSGCGVPGLLYALWTKTPWILVESEKKKADFLQLGIQTFGLNKCQVIPVRMEAIQKKVRPLTITCRAVGTIDKIYPWVRRCSTWNKLILFKGPKWEDEKKIALNIPTLRINHEHHYQHPPEFNDRRLVFLTRVPRGTETRQNSGDSD